MQRLRSIWLRACAGGAIALCAQSAVAQAGDVQKGLSHFFRALEGLQQPGAGGAQAPADTRAAGGLDSPQNVEAVVNEARERKRVSGTTMGSDAWCQAAANPLRPGRVEGSGWAELISKCTAALEDDETNRQQAAAAQELRRVNTERTQNAQARKESEDYEARRQALLAGLKAGTVAPKNCAQWMVRRGLDRYQLQANDISRIGYRAPQGLGYFDAVIQQVRGENILVRLEDHLAVLAMKKGAEVFREGELVEGGRIGVVGQQSGTRTLTSHAGSTVTLAVIDPSCVVGAPDHLLDLMPDGEQH